MDGIWLPTALFVLYTENGIAAVIQFSERGKQCIDTTYMPPKCWFFRYMIIKTTVLIHLFYLLQDCCIKKMYSEKHFFIHRIFTYWWNILRIFCPCGTNTVRYKLNSQFTIHCQVNIGKNELCCVNSGYIQQFHTEGAFSCCHVGLGS